MIEIRDGSTKRWTIDPRAFGYGGGTPADIAGGPPAANAATVVKVLRGDGNSPATAAVVLNAAAALYVSSGGPTEFGDAVVAARAGLQDGAGLRALERLRAAYGRAEPGAD